MQRQLRTLTAALLLVITGLLTGVQSAAQSIQWSGNYYIAVGEAASAPAVVAGHPGRWEVAPSLRALAGADFVDLALQQLPPGVSTFAPDHRYDLLAVGMSRTGAVTVEGYENEGAPVFASEALLVPNVGMPYAVLATGQEYLLVAARSPEGPVFTGDYVVAYGTPEKWDVAPGPDFRGGLFTDMAVTPAPVGNDELRELVAIGTRNEQTVVVRGTLDGDRPSFATTSEMEVIPTMVRPISIEWTGLYFVVMGMDAEGRTLLVYGRPGAWNDSKTLLSGGFVPTSLAVVQLPDDSKRGKTYELVAIGRMKSLVVTVSGEEAYDSPMLHPEWTEVPGLSGSPSAVAPSTSATVSATVVGAATPNPFANRSDVAITVGTEQAVLVEVFDAIGRRVQVLHNGVLAAGVAHSFSFDAQDLPSGTYHFRINGIDFSAVRTVTLAR